MILVDTSVWSEALRPRPDSRVRSWAEAHRAQLWISTVVIGELLSGAELLPEGQRRNALQEAYDKLFRAYGDRIVPFDLDAARLYAMVVARQTQAGRNPGTADSQIAATAIARGMRLATRNVRHFEGLGIGLIDPWSN